MSRKLTRSRISLLTSKDSLQFFAWLIPGAIWVFLKDRRLIPFLVISFMLFCVFIIFDEMWYRIFYVLGVLIAVMLLVVAAYGIANAWQPLRERKRRFAWGCAIALVVLAGNMEAHNIDISPGYPDNMSFFSMSPQSAKPYNDPTDISAVATEVRKLVGSVGSNVQYIEILPWADAFFFLEMRSDTIKFSRPLFCERIPNVLLFHDSPTFLPQFRAFLTDDLKARGIDPIDSERHLIHSNSSGEKWYARIIER